MFSGAREMAVTGHSVWSHDAHVIMQDISHLNLITMSLLQTCSYVTEQMQTPITINVNKFMESFSIKADGGDLHPPSWLQGKDNSITLSPSHTLTPSQKPFTMDDYSQCWQAEAICWINLQEKCALIIACLQPVTSEEYQACWDAVKSEKGPIHRKGI